MHGPNGANYPTENIFAEIESPRGLSVQHISGPKFRLTIKSAPSALGAVVTWDQTFQCSEVAKRVKAIVVSANGQNLDRPAAEVLRDLRKG
jgi:hypothetical protein